MEGSSNATFVGSGFCLKCGSPDPFHYPFCKDIVPPCPSCARIAAKMKDREGIARFLFYVRWPAPENNWDRHAVKDAWYKKADEFLRWMEE